jgi:hypothetical protein
LKNGRYAEQELVSDQLTYNEGSHYQRKIMTAINYLVKHFTVQQLLCMTPAVTDKNTTYCPLPCVLCHNLILFRLKRSRYGAYLLTNVHR